MKPLISIVIPVYHHKEEVVACLYSLAKQTYQPLEIIIVDDGSCDDLVARLTQETSLPPYTLITLPDNSGAPVARNRGFAASSGEYVIFLDADALLESDMLEKLWRALQEHSEAAFAYSGFLFGGKRFACEPFNSERLKKVNYIHTSALIRREEVIPFDSALKKFQDWDVWIRMARAGKRGVFVPEILFSLSTKERAGRMSRWLPSFFYKIPWWMMGWSPREIEKADRARRVLEEKHAGWMTIVERPTEVMIETAKRVRLWTLGILCVELVSLVATFFPGVNTAIALLLAIGLGYWAYRSPPSALALLAAELLIGGKGGLFKAFAAANNDGGINGRLLLFAAWVLGVIAFLWGDRARLRARWNDARRNAWGMGTLIIIGVLVGWGVLRGFVLEQSFLVADANAWGFWVLAPFLLVLWPEIRRALITWIVPASIAAITWLCVKTLFLFSIFAFFGRSGFLSWIYLWVRRTGVGEITLVSSVWPRVFFQSHIYLVPALIVALILLWHAVDSRKCLLRPWLLGAAATLFAALVITLSRSLWIGAFVGIGTLLAWLFTQKATSFRTTVKEGIGIIMGGLILVFALSASPRIWLSGSGWDALKNRVDVADEAAAVSRWQMLPPLKEAIAKHPWFGSGFGATVTYRSEDPRIVQKTGGLYTTYAFEWGWLDLWYKLGAIALGFFLAWYGWLLVKLWNRRDERFAAMLLFSLIALGVVHAFTPYVNHPLGIGLLLTGYAYFLEKRNDQARA